MEPRVNSDTPALKADLMIACCHYDGLFFRVAPKDNKFVVTREHEFGFGGPEELGTFGKVEHAIFFFASLLGSKING